MWSAPHSPRVSLSTAMRRGDYMSDQQMAVCLHGFDTTRGLSQEAQGSLSNLTPWEIDLQVGVAGTE